MNTDLRSSMMEAVTALNSAIWPRLQNPGDEAALDKFAEEMQNLMVIGVDIETRKDEFAEYLRSLTELYDQPAIWKKFSEALAADS